MIEKIDIKDASIVEAMKVGLKSTYLKNNPIDNLVDCNAVGHTDNNGLYRVVESTLNIPQGANYRAILLVLSQSSYHYQEYIEMTTGKRYCRFFMSSSGWSPWVSNSLT